VGFVALLLIHEMGHYVAARHRGLDVGLPTFIPFVGAWVELKDLPHDAETEAYVGMAGPLVGSAGALACFYLARDQGSSLLLALAYSGFFLNLFNLIPLAPFDGGRITAAISPRLWLLGAPLLVALFFYSPSPLLILMARPAHAGGTDVLHRACRDSRVLCRRLPWTGSLPRHHVRAVARRVAARSLGRRFRNHPSCGRRGAGCRSAPRSSGLRTPFAPLDMTWV
jgi:hypothetical protein